VTSLDPKLQTVLPEHRHFVLLLVFGFLQLDVYLSGSMWLGFEPRPVRVTFIVDTVALGQIFVPVHSFSPFSMFPLLLRTEPYLALTLRKLV
jgi:hypothetical protein